MKRHHGMLVVIAGLLASTGMSSTQAAELDTCDVSWLWPVPTNVTEAGQRLTMDKLLGSDGKAVWSQGQLDRILTIAKSTRPDPGFVIAVNPEFNQLKNWMVVGARFDPTAPGGDPKIRAQFGSIPQIRLIVQPVVVDGNSVRVHDVAAHLVFSYVTGVEKTDTTIGKFTPNKVFFKKVVDDLVKFKAFCKSKGVNTSGVGLGVHPGLSNAEISKEAGAVLSRHLKSSDLGGMAFMGLPNGFEPWIFIGSQFIRAAQDYVALPVSGLEPSQKAQMLSFIGADRVVPDPQTDNLNPTTNALFVPKDKRKGVSTAVLYKGNLDINAAAVISASGETSAKLKNKDIPNVIADPRVSHFFNTDCISCHTETIRRTDLGLTPDSFKLKGISGIKEADRQKGRWNVRNFGWFFDILGGRKVTPSVAQRTANESSEAAEFINHEYLKH